MFVKEAVQNEFRSFMYQSKFLRAIVIPHMHSQHTEGFDSFSGYDDRPIVSKAFPKATKLHPAKWKRVIYRKSVY